MTQKFLCNKCNRYTPVVRKTDKLANDVQHEYAECVNCGYKATFLYTDKHIRKLMKRQGKETVVARRIERSEQILKEQNALMKKIALHDTLKVY